MNEFECLENEKFIILKNRECEKLIEEYANSWAILNQEYGGMPSGGSQLMKTLYCSPNNSKPVKKVYSYHDTDDKK